MNFLRQSTAVTLRIGPFIDIADGYTHLTDLNTGSPADLLTSDVLVSKNNGAFGAKNDTTEPGHDSNGFYTCALDTTDTGTLGPFRISAAKPALWMPVWHDYAIVPADIYDMYYSGGLNDLIDAWFVRNFAEISEGSPDGERNALNALRRLRNKVAASGATLTVTKEDDSATAWTAGLTTNASADPITEIDPD